MSAIDFSKADRTAVLFRSLTDKNILYILCGAWRDFTRKFNVQISITAVDKHTLKEPGLYLSSHGKMYLDECLESINRIKTEIAALPKTKKTARYIQSAGLADVDIYSPYYAIRVFYDDSYNAHYEPKAIAKIFEDNTPGTIFTEDWN